MPKSIKEISNFDKGTLFNISEKDAPLEAAAFSLNINPIAENGILDAIKAHRLAISIDKLNEIDFAYPVTYGSAGSSLHTDGYNNATYNNSTVVINNIQSANNQAQCSIRLEGTKGRSELLRIYNIEPWVEKTMITSALAAAYVPAAAFTVEDVHIDYLSDTNAITGTVTNVTFDGFTDNEATIVVNSINGSNELDTDEFVITTPDGTIKTYLFDDDDDGATGTIATGGKVRIQINGLSTEILITAQVKAAIEHANGHNGKITIVQTDGEVEGVADLTPTTGESNLSAAWTTDVDYENIDQFSTSGSGIGCVIDVETTTLGSGLPTVTIIDKGSGYASSDTIVFNEPALATNLVPNGTMEVDSGWNTVGGCINVQSDLQAKAGTYSRKIITDAANEGILSTSFTVVASTDYVVSFWVYPDNTTTVGLKFVEGNGTTVQTENQTGLTQGTWNYVEVVITNVNGGGSAQVGIDSGGETTDDYTWYVDEVSVQRQNTLTLTVNDISSKLALTDVHGSLEKYFEVGDYLSFVGTGRTYTGRTDFEFMEIEDIDTAIRRIYLKRMCFGTKSFPLLTTHTDATCDYDDDPTITHDDDNGKISIGMLVSGTGIPTGASVLSVTSDTEFELSQATTGGAVTNGTLTFTQNSYDIYSNKLTIDGIQNRTTRGTGYLSDWSGYSGNHIGGNANYYTRITSAQANDKKSVGVIDTSTYSIVFSNSAKTMTFTAPHPFVEQDTITIWGSGDDVINSGESFKVLQIDGNIVHLDTAPTDGTISSGIVYIEANLLKNHAFHHSVEVTGVGDTVLGADKEFKLNNWAHYGYFNSRKEGVNLITNAYAIQKDDVSAEGNVNDTYDTSVVHVTTGDAGPTDGGYWEDDTAGHIDLAESYYPCSANDAYVSIESEYEDTQITIVNTTSIGIEDTHILCNGNIDTIFSDNDILLIEAEYMRVTGVDGVNLFVERAIMGAIGTGEANIAAVHNNGVAISKCLNMLIRQDVSNTVLEKKQAYNLTFFAKADSGTAAGALSLRLGPGYFQKDGIWIPNSNNPEKGMANRIVQQEDRWIEFSELDKPDGDIADGDEGLDSTWRKFSIIFYIPEDVEFTTTNADLRVEFASRGLDGSKIGIDLADLREHQIALLKKHDMIAPSSSGFINNSGIKDLIIYDKEDEELTAIPGFKLNQAKLLRPISAFDKSLYASERTKSKTGDVTYTAKNRETHIAFGSGAEDSPPQWLGYVNSKVFDEDTTDKLYQDEDTVHAYDAGSTTSLSKVCVAGEHEHLKAYWNNHSGGGALTDNCVGAEDMPIDTLRIHHVSHSMNIGDNIVIREWQDVSNDWDGRGVWIIMAIQDDYFDCKRFKGGHTSQNNDLDPTELGTVTADSSALDTANGLLSVNTTGSHGLRTGDYILIYGSTSFNTDTTAIGPITVTGAETFTVPHASTNTNENGTIVKEFRLCYRPYYYYGIKEGDSAIYRISPDTRIAGSTADPDDGTGSIALDATGDYVRGTIERSIETRSPIGSITTCYNKKSDGTGGGMVYILASDASDYKDTKIKAIDVQVAYNKWTEERLDEVLTFVPKFKAFKWSNDSNNGNINPGAPESTTVDLGTVKVFGSLASSSTPSIKAAGIPSDILETKGPNHTYDSQATTNTTNNPTMFDTRLWLQFRPGGNESFSEGDRFLFASRTMDYHFSGGDRQLNFADRTPPTTTVFGKEVRYGGGNEKFRSGPGVHPTKGDTDNVHKRLNDGILKHYAYYCNWLGKKGEGRDYLKRISFVKNGYRGANSTTDIDASFGKHPYFHFGYNVGWDGHGGKFPAIKVPKYGLAPMLDNDHDGIIDGTGLVVPSLKTLPDQVNNIRTGPYGNYHQRVCAHAVAVMATSNKPWVRHWGKLMDFSNYSHFVSGNTRSDKWPTHMDAPENMKADKMLFISSDVHYGDFQPRKDYNLTAIATSSNADIGGYHAMVKVTTASYGTSDIGKTMQAGDMVFLKANGYNKPCYIVRVLASNQVILSLKWTVNHTGTCVLYPFTRKVFTYTRPSGTRTYTGIATTRQSFHWAYDDKKNSSGTRFTKKNQAGGHFVKNWWTAPTSFGFNSGSPAAANLCNPGVLNRIEKLNYRAGCMIRPFDKNTSTFIGLQCGNGTVMSIASAPDAVYHQKNGNYLHYNVGTTTKALSNNIKHNSKLHIADDTAGTKYSRMFLADTSFLFPDKKHSVEVQKTTSKAKTHAFNDYPLWKPLFAGKIHTCHDTSSGWLPNAGLCPVIQITNTEISYNNIITGRYKDRGVWVGACLSVRDVETGIIQTRQIVESASSSANTYLHVHYPFAHKPADEDTFWVWKHAYACTAPLKLYRDTNIGHSLGRAYFEDGNDTGQEDKSNIKSPFKSAQVITNSATSGSGYIQLTTQDIHHYDRGDKIKVTGTDSYDGIHTLIGPFYNPRLLRFAHTATATGETGTVNHHVADSVNVNNNSIKIEIDRPLLCTMFGGLDLRKSFSYTLAGQPDITGDYNIYTTTINHNIKAGDSITLNMDEDDGKDGSFDVYEITATDEIKVINSDSSPDDSGAGAGTAHNLCWESLIASQTGTAKLGEISHGLYSWGRGRESGSILRWDRDTASDDDIYMTTSQTVIDIQASSGSNTAGYFKANNIYRYKVSLIYDGYQEGLLSSGTWEYTDTVGRDSLEITMQIKEYSNRLTHMCIYRKDSIHNLYKLVKEVRTDTDWEYDDEKYSYEFEDDGQLGATYESRSGLSEILDTIKVKYGMSTEIDGYLFAGDCGHDKIENAENLVFRSKPGKFSTFDYVNDYIQLKSKPTAMANFLGRLFIFDSTNIYKVNQETLVIEDVFEGIGCIGKDSVTVTENGMFFADRNGAYLHNGTLPTKISDSIFQSGGTDTAFGGTDNIKDISWTNTAGNVLARPPYVIYDSIIESVLFFVEYLDKEIGDDDQIKHLKSNYIWSFHLKKQRWDLWELDKDSELGVPFTGDKGEVLVPIDNGIYEVRGSGKKMDYTWMSKKINMTFDSVIKVYNKIKINGIQDNINLNGSKKESSDRLLIQTNTGAVSPSDITYKTSDTDHSSYKISGSNRKGRWMQFKLEDMTEPIDSIGIIYRLRAVK